MKADGAQASVPNMKTPKLGRAKRRARVVGRVVLSGQDHYTKSEWGPAELPSRECMEEYLALVAAWEARGREPMNRALRPTDPQTMGALVDAWEAHLRSLKLYEVSGEESTTWRFLKPTLAGWKESFGAVRTVKFRKGHLMAYRHSQEKLVADQKMMPRHANRRLARIRDFIVWAIQQELLPEDLGWTADHLPRVKDSLHRATIEARRHPKRAVSQAEVDRVAEACSETYGDMLRVHRMIGCRPGELCAMHAREIEPQDDGWWKWTPTRHKTQHRGIVVYYWIPQEAQEILKKRLKPGRFLFETTNPLAEDRQIGTENYRSEVVSACERAGVPRFTPHEIRHAVATARANDPQVSLAAAGASLGHKRLSSLQPYVHRQDDDIKNASRIS